LHAASRTLLKELRSNENTTAVSSSSVGIDVIVSSGVVRLEHLLEFLFQPPGELLFAYVGHEDRVFLPD
jgi:hypothetical protein